ncbi:MAG: hypothetical protein E7104_01435 [Prevotella sp.]|nr:hypothetical protein [Prevotella sp.]
MVHQGVDNKTAQKRLSKANMIEKADIQKISDLPIEQVADALGLRVKRHWSLCPFHNDSNPSLYYRVAKNKYRCFVCEHYGGPIDLTMQVLNLNFHDAVCWLAQAFGISIQEEHVRKFNVKPREVKPVKKFNCELTLGTEQLSQMIATPVLTEEARHFLFDERKIDSRVVHWCGLSSTHTHLLIPYFNIDGSLQSVQWRYLGNDPKEPRFRFPKGSHCGIYNLPVLKLLKPGEPLYIAEGCSDCWALLSSGRKAIAIPSATLLTAENIKLLKGVFQADSPPFPTGEGRGEAFPFHMYPDQDAPGERLFLQLKELLSKQFAARAEIIRHQLPPGHKDFGSWWASRNLAILTP